MAKVIYIVDADFNAKLEDGRVRMGSLCSQKSICRALNGVLGRVLLSDGELVAHAVLEPSDGGIVARIVDGPYPRPPSERSIALENMSIVYGQPYYDQLADDDPEDPMLHRHPCTLPNVCYGAPF